MNLFNYVKYTFIFLLLFANSLSAQKVGLVLSGGGAKGMTHIGIIRALEENNIPIDYITGTSMGAIVGSLYAMGYSPDDMEELIGSEEFKRWYTGQIEQKYIYYFKANPPTPEFFNIRLSIKDTLRSSSAFPNIFPTSIVNPVQMNLAFIELFAPSTAACRRNFDNLFVPFRCIASDVYNKQQLVLGVGDLGDAVRASMSFPGMFRPIKMNDVLVYDGGIYNNFPTDVMREDFNPDIIIGSVVSANPSKPDENDLMSQIENMVMQKTDYSLPDSLGILLNFKYDDVNLMDFDRLQELHDIGYNHTISMMDSIKQRIHRRVSLDNVNLRRMVYRSHLPELIFGRIIIEGANPQQSAYIKKEFREDEDGITFEEFKEVYFRLLADNMIAEIIPHANYNPKEHNYNLHLKVKLRSNFSIRVGGSVSSSSSNQIYFGVTYQDLNLYAKELIFDGQLGKIYNNLQIAARIDFPTTIPVSYKFIGSISTFDYYKKENIFSGRDHPAFTKKREQFVKIKAALPFLANKKAEFGFGVAGIEDQYTQSHIIDFNNLRYDKSSYFLYGGSITFGGRTLNTKQFATKGRAESLIAQIYLGKEKYYPGEILEDFSRYKKNHSWLQLSYQNEMYHQLAHKFVLGSYMELYYSSKNFSENYTATLLQAGEFNPTVHSKFSYNEAFRANQFVAGGIKPIYLINNLFHLRGEFYGFLPILPIEKNSINNPYYGKAFTKFRYMGEASVVCQLPFGAISAYVNHYSSPKRNWNFGLTLGWQLFNSRFIE